MCISCSSDNKQLKEIKTTLGDIEVRRNIFFRGFAIYNIMEKEIWKDVPEYQDYYQVSNLGRFRSLDRTVVYVNGREQFYKGKIIEGYVDKDGYRTARLSMGGVGRTFRFSQIVAMTFLNHRPNGMRLVVDHKNGNRLDDRLENLRIVTHRENGTTCFRKNKKSYSSSFVGVSWSIANDKWRSEIHFNGRGIRLGYFTNELEASTAYQKALSKINDGSFNPEDYKSKLLSKYKGVSFYKSSSKWMAQIRIDGKQKYLGTYKTELEAHHAYQKALKERQNVTTL